MPSMKRMGSKKKAAEDKQPVEDKKPPSPDAVVEQALDAAAEIAKSTTTELQISQQEPDPFPAAFYEQFGFKKEGPVAWCTMAKPAAMPKPAAAPEKTAAPTVSAPAAPQWKPDFDVHDPRFWNHRCQPRRKPAATETAATPKKSAPMKMLLAVFFLCLVALYLGSTLLPDTAPVVETAAPVVVTQRKLFGLIALPGK